MTTLCCLSTKLCILLTCLFYTCNSHPQCLDFRAPFHAQSPLQFCPEYENFGCCTVNSDNDIQTEYNRIRSIVSADTWTKCGTYIRDLLCQKCSPYAAHIYDAESTLKPRAFPGLCRPYCEQFYSSCRNLIQYLAYNDTTLIEESRLGVDKFCNHVSLVDTDYCYPDLKTNDILNNKIDLVQVTTEGCLCVENFASGLHNPVFARHAGDSSGRLFVGEVSGKIYVYNLKGVREPQPFLDLKDVTLNTHNRGDERGLLGLAFHPNFSSNGRLFIYYSTYTNQENSFPPVNHKIRISEFLISRNNRNRADKSSERVILEVPQPFWNHNGGEVSYTMITDTRTAR